MRKQIETYMHAQHTHSNHEKCKCFNQHQQLTKQNICAVHEMTGKSDCVSGFIQTFESVGTMQKLIQMQTNVCSCRHNGFVSWRNVLVRLFVCIFLHIDEVNMRDNKHHQIEILRKQLGARSTQ